MNVLTAPRRIAKLEYSMLRLPTSLLQGHVVEKFLEDDSKLRLGIERTLGSLDETAGRLLADPALLERGRQLRHRSEVLTKAVELDEVADQRAAAAEDKALKAASAAQRLREQAAATLREGVQQAAQQERAAKTAAERAASQRAQAGKARVQAQAQSRAQAVAADLDAEEARISAAERARTAVPVAQLTNAVQQKQTAAAERATAKRLADLAAAERASRKSARS